LDVVVWGEENELDEDIIAFVGDFALVAGKRERIEKEVYLGYRYLSW